MCCDIKNGILRHLKSQTGTNVINSTSYCIFDSRNNIINHTVCVEWTVADLIDTHPTKNKIHHKIYLTSISLIKITQKF